MNRFLKYINYLVIVLLVSGAAGAYWLAWRVLPQTSGKAAAPVSAPVAVVRDAQGVPHIEGSSDEDVWFAQGYVTAQDRLFQLEMARRLPAGELAEIVGRPALESDIEGRRLRLRRVAEAHAHTMPAEDRRAFAAYARGVNHYVETHRGALPVEFTLLGFDPAPWTIPDSVLVGLQMYRSMTNAHRDEILKRNLLESGEAQKVHFLFPSSTGGEVQLGSNAWAVAGRHTKSGKPLLASDPHLGFSLPGIWYQVHLKTPSMNVAGVGLPGLPGVGIGHNDQIAWGVTNLGFDVQDLYQERMNLVLGVAQFKDKLEPVRQLRETVRIRGAGKVDVIVPVTRHGSIVFQEQNLTLALRWMATEPGVFEYPHLELNRARNWEEFRKALRRFPGPGFNFVYADREGNIGLQVAGKFPIRENYDGDVPQPGWTGEHEWRGVIPFDDLPSFYNPPSGRVITGNQNPFPAGYKYRVHGNFAPHYRCRQIEAMLARKTGWTPEMIMLVQRDVYSPFSHFLAQQIVEASKRRNVTNPDLKDAVEVLRTWNGQMESTSPAALVVTLAYQHLRKGVVDRAAGGKGSLYDAAMGTAVIEQLFRSRPEDWFTDYDQVLVRALLDGVEEGVKMQGRDVRAWQYGMYNELQLKQPVVSELPWVGKYFNITAPMGGSTTTVRQTTRRAGPSMRFVADLADWENSRMVILSGQSGQPFSPHRKDQWPVYYGGGNLRMQYGSVEAVDTLTLVPIETR